MNKTKMQYDVLYKTLIRVLKKVELWKEYESILCDAFNSICGLKKRLEIVKEGENTLDKAGVTFSIGVLAEFPGCAHTLAQQLSIDIENNWKIVSQQLTSLNALVVYEINKMQEEITNTFTTIPVGAIASQGSGIPIMASECELWIIQINKMIYGEYLRKRELFTAYTTNQVTDILKLSSEWPASSKEGMVDFSLLNEIADRITMNNK